jgi:hypothetical protein
MMEISMEVSLMEHALSKELMALYIKARGG